MRMKVSSICSPADDILQMTNNDNTLYCNINSTPNSSPMPKNFGSDLEKEVEEETIEKENKNEVELEDDEAAKKQSTEIKKERRKREKIIAINVASFS